MTILRLLILALFSLAGLANATTNELIYTQVGSDTKPHERRVVLTPSTFLHINSSGRIEVLDAAGFRTASGLVIGTNVQAHNTILDDFVTAGGFANGLWDGANSSPEMLVVDGELYLGEPAGESEGAVPIGAIHADATTLGAFRSWLAINNLDNTSDANKPISTATATALAGKLPTTGGTLTGDLTASASAASIGYWISNGSATSGSRNWKIVATSGGKLDLLAASDAWSTSAVPLELNGGAGGGGTLYGSWTVTGVLAGNWTATGNPTVSGNLTVNGLTSLFGGTANNNQIIVQRTGGSPSSIALQAYTSQPTIILTGGSGWTTGITSPNGPLVLNDQGSEALRCTNADVAVAGALNVNGNATLGDASGDALTINAGSPTAPNASTLSSTSSIGNRAAHDTRYPQRALALLGAANFTEVTRVASNYLTYTGSGGSVSSTTLYKQVLRVESGLTANGWASLTVGLPKMDGTSVEYKTYIVRLYDAVTISTNGTLRIAAGNASLFNAFQRSTGTGGPAQAIGVDFPTGGGNCTVWAHNSDGSTQTAAGTGGVSGYDKTVALKYRASTKTVQVYTAAGGLSPTWTLVGTLTLTGSGSAADAGNLDWGNSIIVQCSNGGDTSSTNILVDSVARDLNPDSFPF